MLNEVPIKIFSILTHTEISHKIKSTNNPISDGSENHTHIQMIPHSYTEKKPSSHLVNNGVIFNGNQIEYALIPI